MTAPIWLGANLSFLLLTLFIIASAALAAFSPNIVRAAYSLFFTLLGVAGYFVLLGSGFLAITQVIIYVGGILVLLLFGILLTDRPLTGKDVRLTALGAAAGALDIVLLLGVLWWLLQATSWRIAPTLRVPAETIKLLGEALLNRYLLVFEASGVTLLLCLFAAAYLVRREEK